MRAIHVALFWVLASISGTTIACDDHAPGKEPARHSVSRESTWVAGEILDVDLVEGTITLAHDRIASLRMDAMKSMQFKAASTKLIVKAKPGDKVKFRVAVIDEQPTVTRLAAVMR